MTKTQKVELLQLARGREYGLADATLHPQDELLQAVPIDIRLIGLKQLLGRKLARKEEVELVSFRMSGVCFILQAIHWGRQNGNSSEYYPIRLDRETKYRLGW